MEDRCRWIVATCVTAGVLAGSEALFAQPAQPTPTVDESKNARACQENLSKLDGAKEQFALEYKSRNGAPVMWQNLLDPEATGKLGMGYLKSKPVCPSGGTYTLNNIGTDPTCSIGITKGEGRFHTLDGTADGTAPTTAPVVTKAPTPKP